MIRFADGEAALFSVKCFIAAMLAYYIALRIGLTRPYWAVTTSYIVAQPLAGAVLSKAVFRLVGTALGAAAAVVLVPSFVNAPAVLSFALGLWLALCLYVSLLDRTPRAYTFLLAGYTASIIGFPAVDAAGGIFTVAVLRVQEITIGILCGSLIHGVVLPRSVSARLLDKVDAMLADAERWSRDALRGAREQTLDLERRRLALELSELYQLSIHLPFDTARLLPRTRTVRALLDQFTLLLPLATTVEDRLAELALCPGGLPAPVAALVTRTAAWLETGLGQPDREAVAATLIADAAALEPATIDGATAWRDMLLLNLLSRLGDLVALHRDGRALRDQLRAPGPRPITPRVAALLHQAGARGLHRDRGLAVRAGLGTLATMLLACTFWIGTAWTDGAGAVLIAGVCCALFGNVDDPGPVIFTFLLGSAAGIGLALVYAYAVLPRATSFVTVAAALAPVLLILGSMLARPPLTLFTLGTLLGLLNTVGLNASYSGDFATFANGAVAQLIGTGFAVVTVGLFQTIGADTSIGRLLRASWRDVARRARGRAPDAQLWSARMLDRIGLLMPRLAQRREEIRLPLMDVLTDMRIGFVAGELDRLAATAPDAERRQLRAMLDRVAGHFCTLRPAAPEAPPPALLGEVDAALALFATDPEPARRRTGLTLLTSLRRNLFPEAPRYEAAA
ncbi:FUSC family protein [Sphingomonas morindae]|uniref:FUSC family protein n=1 Tax=Sphingomonas morindae TaxID=1541170 RepID=A0ABY4XAR3_9SPHN|nr:FUSC family protein [Sphingomonas morindae]USI74034.1 FUSC family protein [Sphingomonas morindae]